MMDPEALISELVGEMFPRAVPVDGRLRRNWVARVVKPLPSQEELSRMKERLERDRAAVLEDAYGAYATPERLNRVKPSILLVRLDDLHPLFRVDFAEPVASVGDADAIVQFGTLQLIDREIEIDDLQGLPSNSWFFLRCAREARESS